MLELQARDRKHCNIYMGNGSSYSHTQQQHRCCASRHHPESKLVSASGCSAIWNTPEASQETTAAAAAGNKACATRATPSANLAHRSDGRNPGKYIVGLLLSRHPQELVSQEEYDDLKPLSKLKTVAGPACSSDSCGEDHPRNRSERVISIL